MDPNPAGCSANSAGMFRRSPRIVRWMVGHFRGQASKAVRHCAGVYPASRNSFATRDRSRISVRVACPPSTSSNTSRYGKFGCVEGFFSVGWHATAGASAMVAREREGETEREKEGELAGGL